MLLEIGIIVLGVVLFVLFDRYVQWLEVL